MWPGRQSDSDLSGAHIFYQAMMLLYPKTEIFIFGLCYKLGSERHELNELKAAGLLAGSVETLSGIGYRCCFGLQGEETLLKLAADPLSRVLEHSPNPRALIFQHCHAQSAVLPWDPGDVDIASRNRYFQPALMQQLQVDHIPFFCSFASGCAGFISLLAAAGGFLSSSDGSHTACIMADSRPDGVTFDMERERILGSDHSSAFVVGRESGGYQLLGINYYSTTRTLVPLLEVVKRAVDMINDLARSLSVNLSEANVAIHYPNLFPETWKMVTRYLRITQLEPVMDEMAERAHCGGSDSVISLAKLHRRHEGRLHIVVNYGLGLHLAVCILKEKELAESRTYSGSPEVRNRKASH
jgi:hypothetical protein